VCQGKRCRCCQSRGAGSGQSSRRHGRRRCHRIASHRRVPGQTMPLLPKPMGKQQQKQPAPRAPPVFSASPRTSRARANDAAAAKAEGQAAAGAAGATSAAAVIASPRTVACQGKRCHCCMPKPIEQAAARAAGATGAADRHRMIASHRRVRRQTMLLPQGAEEGSGQRSRRHERRRRSPVAPLRRVREKRCCCCQGLEACGG